MVVDEKKPRILKLSRLVMNEKKRLEWMILWKSCSIVITFDAVHLDDDNRASLCDYSACNTVAGWWELTWDDQGVWEISLCIFGNVFFLPKMWEMWFPPKNTRLIFYSQFLPSKSNIEGWQKTNRKCRKCCASFPFWYRPNYRGNFHFSCFPFSIFLSFSSFTLTYVSGFCPGNECWHCCAIRGQSRQTFTCDHKNFETKKELEER